MLYGCHNPPHSHPLPAAQTFRLAPDVQGELSRLTEEFVQDLVERGCQLAAIRKANTLRALDLAP